MIGIDDRDRDTNDRDVTETEIPMEALDKDRNKQRPCQRLTNMDVILFY